MNTSFSLLLRVSVLLSIVMAPVLSHAQTLDPEESAFVTLLNNYRIANGVGPLAISPALSNSSRWMSNDMAAKNYFSHTDSLGRDPVARLATFGYTFYPLGENLAAGYASAQNTLTQWINACDPDASGSCTYGHRNNLLNGAYKVMGIARAAGPPYGWYWTNDFGGVVDQPQSSPSVNSFTASSQVITIGQSTTLAWSVSGATSVTIDNGVGDQTSVTSKTVSPASTTTYKLTATNSSGSSSATVTVTVNPVATIPITPPPAISSFSASPSAITAGQSTILVWISSGSTGLSIDNGIGVVTGLTYKAVTPSVTTTYHLTASNGTGSTTAVTTVTVTAPAADTQAPTIPTMSSATAKGATEADLTWTASTDNVGVAGYQILRNGGVVGSVGSSVLSWADTSVAAKSTYSYSVKAFDAAGNYSAASNSLAVTMPSSDSPTCLTAGTNAFTGCYYSNISLTGNPVLVRTDGQINFDWSTATPDPSVPANFSVRWLGNFTFDQATYAFTVTASDGIRIYIDGSPYPSLDRWLDHPLSRYSFQSALTQGTHLITVEYYEHTGSGAAHVSWQSLGGNLGQVPTVSSFTGTPATITAGQSTALAWNVSGASNISIDNGVGAVTGAGSQTVTPAATTTYKLTASNTSGNTVASVTVTVIPAAGDTQAPTPPAINSSVAKSATEVDLTWTASTDNVGVAGYQILRNGSAVGSVGGSVLSWLDNGVSANSTYSYTVKAFDAASNYSAASNVASVTTPAATSSGCPAAAVNAFTGCYFSNISLTGNPALVRTDSQINFDWPIGTPDPSISPSFSVRWQGNFAFDAGAYTFTVLASDGIRVYVDGNLFPLLDKWWSHPAYRYTFQSTLTPGKHLITVEYYDQSGSPSVHISWQKN